MGFFSKKTTSLNVDELLSLSDKEIEKALKSGKAPVRTAKDLRKMAKEDQRKVEGEKGFAALRAAAQEKKDRRFRELEHGMRTRQNPHALARMKAEDPRRYQALLDQEARKQGLI